ncbi:DDE transposase family protein [Halomicronema hongdechloris]|uniref:DDE transposase family protein n=1 Tax=Halomicronema hongdechloris TaxID=1209493 RepID=UPI0009BC4F90|nr:DDE transposase family protein [Halomicronema hongdechloris]
MSDSIIWYILKSATGQCEIVPASQLQDIDSDGADTWGPYDSKAEAIARRVGLIRAGKCRPMQASC